MVGIGLGHGRVGWDGRGSCLGGIFNKGPCGPELIWHLGKYKI